MSALSVDPIPFPGSFRIRIALDRLNDPILANIANRNADVREREDHNVATPDIVLVWLAQRHRIVDASAPVLEIPCAGSLWPWEGVFIATHRLTDAPAHKCSAPWPRSNWQPCGALVLDDPLSAIGLRFANADLRLRCFGQALGNHGFR